MYFPPSRQTTEKDNARESTIVSSLPARLIIPQFILTHIVHGIRSFSLEHVTARDDFHFHSSPVQVRLLGPEGVCRHHLNLALEAVMLSKGREHYYCDQYYCQYNYHYHHYHSNYYHHYDQNH